MNYVLLVTKDEETGMIDKLENANSNSEIRNIFMTAIKSDPSSILIFIFGRDSAIFLGTIPEFISYCKLFKRFNAVKLIKEKYNLDISGMSGDISFLNDPDIKKLVHNGKEIISKDIITYKDYSAIRYNNTFEKYYSSNHIIVPSPSFYFKTYKTSQELDDILCKNGYSAASLYIDSKGEIEK